jgi:hypothetical protein
MSVLGDTAWAPGVEALAGRIAGEEADRELLEKARAIAEAQIDLARMRTHRRRVIEQAWATLESGWTDTTEQRRDAPQARRVKA